MAMFSYSVRTVFLDNLSERTKLFKSDFISTTSELSIATSVPEPMAMPVSALTSAGASFTPSPTIATV